LRVATRSQGEAVQALLRLKGRTFSDEAGIDLGRNTPAVLFQHLCMSMLLSARIHYSNALEAIRALIEAGLTTPQKMAAATWQERVNVITWHGYKRYDARASTMLGETAQLVLDRYGGDLRNLRKAADRDVARERILLQEFSGIGPVGADIFIREVQAIWDEAYPYVDRRVAGAARRLGLPSEPAELASLVPPHDFVRLTAALIRTDLDKAYDEILGG
jgi:endonuclease III